mmetsp:Transcript_59901/g.110962  ORF Transcript_59901/g.110962 Transcript_59901/m.110962 type:complete len:218 (-) Transcript_59901:208-861(-)
MLASTAFMPSLSDIKLRRSSLSTSGHITSALRLARSKSTSSKGRDAICMRSIHSGWSLSDVKARTLWKKARPTALFGVEQTATRASSGTRVPPSAEGMEGLSPTVSSGMEATEAIKASILVFISRLLSSNCCVTNSWNSSSCLSILASLSASSPPSSSSWSILASLSPSSFRSPSSVNACNGILNLRNLRFFSAIRRKVLSLMAALLVLHSGVVAVA